MKVAVKKKELVKTFVVCVAVSCPTRNNRCQAPHASLVEVKTLIEF